MTSIRSLVALCALSAASAPGLLRAAMVDETPVVHQDRRTADVVVWDVRTAGDTVSGTVANRAPDPVRNVRLAVSSNWLWDDEMHPGTDLFSRVDYYIVPEEIPANGQIPFTVRPSTPLHEGSGGRFVTEVDVTSFEVLQQGGYRAPTAGTRAVETPPRRLEGDSPSAGEPPAQPPEE
jgi:hypothetical protein